MPRVQAGLKTMKNPHVILADYGEVAVERGLKLRASRR
jgi:hypothetical protein